MKNTFFRVLFYIGIALQCFLSTVYFGVASLVSSGSNEGFAGTGVVGYVFAPIILSLVLLLISWRVKQKTFYVVSSGFIFIFALLTFVMGSFLLAVTGHPF